MQRKTATNILWYWVCLCLQHCKHLYSWGRIAQTWHSIKNSNDLTMKQMVDLSGKLITEQSDDIYGVKTINWEHSSWKYLSLVGDEQLISLWSAYSHILYCALERWTRTHNQTLHGKTDWRGSKVHNNTELWTELMVSQWNSSWISSKDSLHCSSVKKSNSCCQDWV